MDSDLVAFKYLKSWFWIDFIGTIPVDFVIEGFAQDGVAVSLLGDSQGEVNLLQVLTSRLTPSDDKHVPRCRLCPSLRCTVEKTGENVIFPPQTWTSFLTSYTRCVFMPGRH